jgi:hypothetical protein
MRGCDGETDEVHYAWAPELKRCPKSQMTPEVMECVQWWSEWRQMGWLPWPGTIHDQPARVYDALMICQLTQDQMDREKAANG